MKKVLYITILCRFVSQFTIGIKTAAHRFFITALICASF